MHREDLDRLIGRSIDDDLGEARGTDLALQLSGRQWMEPDLKRQRPRRDAATCAMTSSQDCVTASPASICAARRAASSAQI